MAQPEIKKICKVCKTTFYRRPAIAKVQTICSVKCRGLLKSSCRTAIECANCGKSMSVRPSDLKDGRKYCSRDCLKPMYSKLFTGNKNAAGPSPRKGKKMPQHSGEKHWNWKGGITAEDHSERVRFRRTMQTNIFVRDDYTCQICSTHGVSLQVDHIKSWAKYPELRFEESNCRTLCMACHYYVTFKRKMPEGIVWGHNLNRRIAS